MEPSESVTHKQGMTTARPELGISPVLFQAIAQLTASSAGASTQPGGVDKQASENSVATSLIKQAHNNSREMDSNAQTTTSKDTNRVVSQLLQKLNEPVVSLIPQSSRSASQLLLSTANMTQASAATGSSNQLATTSFTQAGLSMLGLASSDYNSSSPSHLPASTITARTNILGDELNNFLLKQEPVEDDAATASANKPPLPSAQAINTDVSSVLSALASQHAQQQQQQQQQQQSILQGNGDVVNINQQQPSVTSLQLQNTTFHIIHPNQHPASSCSSLTPASLQATVSSALSGSHPNIVNINTASSSPNASNKNQQQPQQIIIYGMPSCDNTNLISTPSSVVSASPASTSVPSRILDDSGENKNLIIEEGSSSAISSIARGANNGQQTTLRLQMQSSSSPSGNVSGGGGSDSSSNNADNNNASNNPNSSAAVTVSQKTFLLSADQNYNAMQQQAASGGRGSAGEGGNMAMDYDDVQPISDVQNTFEGMSQPCPVCGDKVSGYHYGIFTCESCKGFFKRTVQNKKAFLCPKQSDCVINSINRKKCPACRFKRCLQMGMKLQAIRQDRTRGGRSSYEGCTPHKTRPQAVVKKPKRLSRVGVVGGDVMLSGAGGSSSQEMDDGSKSHRNLVAILNHNVHEQSSPVSGLPVVPELLRDIMNLEPLLSDDDITPDSIMEATSFPDQALYSYMMQLAELRLYKLVRWARNLPQFGAISTDDQILLLQNCWSELIGLALCWRSIDTPNQISISSTHHITTEWAQHIGCEDLVTRLLNITNSFRNMYMDEFEYVALKVLLLISPDVKGLKEPRKIRDFQDKLLEALMQYTASHYVDVKNKFGELLLRLPELSRLSFLSKNILLKYLPTSSTTCGLLVELLKGDSRLEQDSGGAGGTAEGGSGGGVDVPPTTTL